LTIREDVPINLVTVQDVVEFIDGLLARGSAKPGPGDAHQPAT
jgi:hypothetical protein